MPEITATDSASLASQAEAIARDELVRRGYGPKTPLAVLAKDRTAALAALVLLLARDSCHGAPHSGRPR